jgi:hypothetical protein
MLAFTASCRSRVDAQFVEGGAGFGGPNCGKGRVSLAPQKPPDCNYGRRAGRSARAKKHALIS